MDELATGAFAGAVGTAALDAIEPIERALIGGEPPFAPRVLARRLLEMAGLDADAASAKLVGNLLQWSYGPGLGIAYALAKRGRRQVGSEARNSLLLAGAILGFEVFALPAIVGRKQFLRPRVLGGLLLHVATFSAVAVAVDTLFGSRD